MIAPDRHPPMAPWLEQAWLMRYLDRQLGADEQAWFEGYLLDKPELLDQVEADTALRDAVAAQPTGGAAASGALDLRIGSSSGVGSAGGWAGAGTGAEDALLADRAALAGASANAALPRTTSQARQRGGGRGVWLAIAASFVGGIGLTALALGVLDDDSAGLVANPSRIIFDTLRGELTEPHIEPGDPASPIILVEFPVPPGARILSVQARVPQGTVALDSPVVAADGYATYAIPASWRGRGTLSIQLHDDRSGEASTMQLPL